MEVGRSSQSTGNHQAGDSLWSSCWTWLRVKRMNEVTQKVVRSLRTEITQYLLERGTRERNQLKHDRSDPNFVIIRRKANGRLNWLIWLDEGGRVRGSLERAQNGIGHSEKTKFWLQNFSKANFMMILQLEYKVYWLDKSGVTSLTFSLSNHVTCVVTGTMLPLHWEIAHVEDTFSRRPPRFAQTTFLLVWNYVHLLTLSHKTSVLFPNTK